MTTVAHVHDHEHGHDHQHGQGHPGENPGAGQGPVVLDIGGDVGALVLEAGPSDVGLEIEISGQDGVRSHVAVLARPLPGGRVLHAAVYPSLRQGRYQLWSPADGRVTLEVDVQGGEVTRARWPASD